MYLVFGSAFSGFGVLLGLGLPEGGPGPGVGCAGGAAAGLEGLAVGVGRVLAYGLGGFGWAWLGGALVFGFWVRLVGMVPGGAERS